MNSDRATAASGGKELKRTLLLFFVVVAAAFAVRLVYLEQLSDNPLFEHPIMDAGVHHEWAQHFARGEPWSVDPRTGEPIPYFRAPLYIWFLGTVYKVFGPDPGLPPRLIQSVLGALSCGLLFLLAQRLFGRAAGLLAGFGAALYWILVYFDNELLIVPLIVFLDLLGIWLLVKAHDADPIAARPPRPAPETGRAPVEVAAGGITRSGGRPAAHWLLWGAAGLALGLSAIARPNVLLFAPFVCLWILVLARRAGALLRGGVPRAVLFGAALLLPIIPVTVRNVAVGEDPVLIASQGGVNFYIGNNPRTDGVTAVVPGTPRDWWGGYFATQDMAARDLGRRPRPSEVSRYFFGKALEFWADEPLRALKITAGKALLFLSRQEAANNRCIYTFTEEFTPLARWLPLGFAVVAPFGLLGLLLLLATRRGMRTFPLWGFTAVYSISIIIFFVTARFRAPVLPPLIAAAAFAVVWLARTVRARRLKPLAAALILLAALGVLVHRIPGKGFGAPWRVAEEFYCTLGTELLKQGDRERALHYVERAIQASRRLLERQHPKQREIGMRVLGNALYLRGTIMEEWGRPADALRAYGDALKRVPAGLPEAAKLHERMARLYAELGNGAAAAEHRAAAARIRRELFRASPDQ